MLDDQFSSQSWPGRISIHCWTAGSADLRCWEQGRAGSGSDGRSEAVSLWYSVLDTLALLCTGSRVFYKVCRSDFLEIAALWNLNNIPPPSLSYVTYQSPSSPPHHGVRGVIGASQTCVIHLHAGTPWYLPESIQVPHPLHMAS